MEQIPIENEANLWHSDEGHEEHHIVSKTMLKLVLGILLFFTLLTVGAAQAEVLFSKLFEVEIAQSVNAIIALSIAVVKTTFVVLFFMQLKYDNPLNGLVFIFTIMTVLLFIGFIWIDLGNRGTIDTFKGQYITEGGTGITTTIATKAMKEKDDIIETNNRPITEIARDARIMLGSSLVEDLHPHGHESSSAEQTRPAHGVTLPGYEHLNDGHDGGHGPAPH